MKIYPQKSEVDYWQKTTFLPPAKIKRRWFCLNLKKKIAGRAAVIAANILRGKDKNIFSYNLDNGDYIVLLNAKCIKFSGKNKLEKKQYYDHSGYIGGLRKRSNREMIENYPKELIFRIIKGMIPHTKLGRKQLKRLFIFSDENHNLLAQQKEFIFL